MSNKHIYILDIPFLITTKQQFLEETIDQSQQKTIHVVTANPEIVMHAYEQPSYKQIVKQADYVIADGIGIIIASKLINKPLPERIPGFELMGEYLKHANETKKSVFLLGAKDHVVKKAAKNIKNKYPDLVLAGYHHGYININEPEVVDAVIRTNPDFIFVALGFPKQEEWIATHKEKLDKGLLMGVGGSIDIWAGEAKRAPEIWLKLHLEWFYRLITNPTTRFKRMLKLPQFILHVLRGK